ncbi:MAG: 3-oxoacyl-ACP reductase [candidate division Zixibacteria bacterium SM23_81]|nr:MAG: 3-oxoacyl-ACP reductase [candidate division Zixibacteria bacterium SM23_81]
MNFKDRVVLVTGASRGIGRAIAQAFAQHGAKVAVHYHRDIGMAEKTMNVLPGGPHQLFCCDVSDPNEGQSLIEDILKKFGRLDVLVNNAGIFKAHPIQKVSYEQWLEDWQRTLATNLVGPANLIYWASQHMIKQGGGRIVNISSRGAFRGEPEAPAYGASKSGLNALSQSLAQALAPHNIFITVVAPGFVETEMARELLSGPDGEKIKRQSPLGRVARPEEVARTVLFLASEGSDYLTGAIVDVNGASYLRS